MKRKFLITISVILLCASPIFANKETDLNFYFTPVENYLVSGEVDDTKFSGQANQTFAFGIEGQWGYFFGSPSDFLDIGLNFSIGVDMMTGYSIDLDGAGSFSATAIGVSMYTQLGPVFSVNLGEMHSIWLSPGIKLGLGIGAATSDVPEAILGFWMPFDFAVAVDVGYRLWVTDGFGVSVGADMSWDIFGFYDFIFPLKAGGFDLNVYIGLCFR